MSLKIEWLKYFILFCEFKNFTETAKKLDITTASLSQNIKALEKYLGTELIKRESNHNKITEQGYIFLEKAKESLLKFEKIESSFKNKTKNNKKNILKIGWTNIWGSNILPEIMEALMKKNETVYPKIYAFTIEEAIKCIELNELDFAIITIKNGNRSFLEENDKISYKEGKIVYFIDILNSDNKNNKKIYLSTSNNENTDFCIKTASIATLVYLCEKGNFSTTLPEILVSKKDLKNFKQKKDFYIQPTLIWNKNIYKTELTVEVINLFMELANK